MIPDLNLLLLPSHNLALLLLSIISFKFQVLNAMLLICHFLQDGRIDYGEFAAMMRKGDGGVGRTRTMRSNLNFNLADALGVENATSDC